MTKVVTMEGEDEKCTGVVKMIQTSHQKVLKQKLIERISKRGEVI